MHSIEIVKQKIAKEQTMRVQYFSQEGATIFFQPTNIRKYRGVLLPGAEVTEYLSAAAKIYLQQFEHPQFGIAHRVFEIIEQVKFFVNERPGLRLEALLSGEMSMVRDNKKIRLKAGQYHVTDVSLFTTLFKAHTPCNIFVTYFSKDLLNDLGCEIQHSPPPGYRIK